MEVATPDNTTGALQRPETPTTQMDAIRIILPYLTKQDIMIVRMLNFEWNHVVNTMCPGFKPHAKMRENWYKEAKEDFGIKVESKTKWNSVTMSHFKFYRNSSTFKLYWQNTATNLETLTISNSSLECDGFKFILENCPVLANLTLDNSRFRDTSDFHSKVQNSGGICEESKRVVRDLRHLKLIGISIFDVCHLTYLVTRCQNLESLLIQECFHPPPKVIVREYNEDIETQKVLVKETEQDQFTAEDFEKIYQDFEAKLMEILLAGNKNRLTKFEFIRNNFDVRFLAKLISVLGQFEINDFTWENHPAAPDVESIITSLEGFLGNCAKVQNLCLVFYKNVINQNLESILGNVQCTLQKLKLSLEGSKLLAPLDLSFLQRFQELVRLEIQDTKALARKHISRLIGGQREEGINPAAIIHLNKTPISTTFLAHLPPKLEELKLDHYITQIDPLPIEPPHLIQDSLKKLQKLEIYGPWIHSMSNLIPFISTNLEHLETLALTACGLDDMMMTGLDVEGVADMYRNLAYAFFTLRDKPNSTADEISDSVCKHMILPPAGGPRLSNLNNLQHLNLSFNNNISNLTLFYGLRIPSLKTLNLNGCSKISDLGMHFIALYNPGLKTLNVKNSRKLSKYGINAAVKGCKGLKTLLTSKAAELRNPREHIDPKATISQNYADVVDVSRSEIMAANSQIKF